MRHFQHHLGTGEPDIDTRDRNESNWIRSREYLSIQRESTSSRSGSKTYLLEVEIDHLINGSAGPATLDQIKMMVVDHFIPLCAWCQQLRDAQGSWHPKETVHLDWAVWTITHTICPTCAAEVTS